MLVLALWFTQPPLSKYYLPPLTGFWPILMSRNKRMYVIKLFKPPSPLVFLRLGNASTMQPLHVQSQQNAVTLNGLHVCEVHLNIYVCGDI